MSSRKSLRRPKSNDRLISPKNASNSQPSGPKKLFNHRRDIELNRGYESIGPNSNYYIDRKLSRSSAKENHRRPRSTACKSITITEKPKKIKGYFDKLEQIELTNCLKQILNIEKAIEAAKIELALKHDFNLMDAFKFFDTNSVNSVTHTDIVNGLKGLDFGSCCFAQVKLLVDRFD